MGCRREGKEPGTGANGADVPWQFSKMLYNDMLEAGQTTELYTYEGDNHNISNSFTTAMDRTVQFFCTYLK